MVIISFHVICMYPVYMKTYMLYEHNILNNSRNYRFVVPVIGEGLCDEVHFNNAHIY